MTKYFLIIITAEEPGEAPFVYFIKESAVTSDMLKEMEFQTNNYPFWCLQSEDPDDPPSFYDIEKFGYRVCPMGSNLKPRVITRCFHYRL